MGASRLALVVAAAVAVGGGPTAAAGQDVEVAVMRSYLADAFERNRAMDLAYLEAAPDSMLRWAPVEGVRDFAQQMLHTTHDFFQFWREGYSAPDTALVLNDRAALRGELDAGYDWAVERLASMSDRELVEVVEVSRTIDAPRWRVMQYWLDHAMWTRASVIPYLRVHGVAPPAVTFW